MENTHKVFFDDPEPRWFVAVGTVHEGPMPAAELYRRVCSHQIQWDQLVWQEGMKDWIKLRHVELFSSFAPEVVTSVPPSKAVPARPSVVQSKRRRSLSQTSVALPQELVLEADFSPVPSESSDKEWFLYFNESQYGPFSILELEGLLKLAKIRPETHGWKDGMPTWVRVDQIPELKIKIPKLVRQEAAVKIPTVRQARKTARTIVERKGPRRPLVARIIVSNNESVIVGMCKDISLSGMQILTDRIPGVPGTHIRLNVTAARKGAAKVMQIQPFTAEGVIVRILEDDRGFSLRFLKLTGEARNVVQRYLDS